MGDSDWRLKDAASFDAVFKGNRFRVSSPAFLFLAMENNLEQCRLGMVIGKKSIKLATHRNRTKRAIREHFRQQFKNFTPTIDLIVLSRVGVNTRDKSALNQQIDFLMQKLKLKIDRELREPHA